VGTVDFRRELAEIKSINYIEAVLLQKRRKELGALEMVYVKDGVVYECLGSNIFIVKNGRLITPKDSIVYGITRKVVLDLAREYFPVEERPVSAEEMFSADEVFITGSFKEVVPVVRIDDKGIGNGAVGPICARIIELFSEFTRTY
jgi:branched-subunit amino acid aminotransferase/4-amino-4-deoxychorismate lyase